MTTAHTTTRDRRIKRTVDRLLTAIDRTVRAVEQVKQARQDLTRLTDEDQPAKRERQERNHQ
jgi:hypothetical protein